MPHIDTRRAALVFTLVIGICVLGLSYSIFYDHVMTYFPAMATATGMSEEQIDLITWAYGTLLLPITLVAGCVAALLDACIYSNVNTLRTIKAGISAQVFCMILFITYIVFTPMILDTLYPLATESSTVVAWGTATTVVNAFQFIFGLLIATSILAIVISPFYRGMDTDYR